MIDEKKLIEYLRSEANMDRSRAYGEYECDLIEGTIRMCIDGVKAQPKVGEWIPCSKELPKESGYYLACIYNSDVDDYDFRKIWFAHKDDYDIEESEWRELYGFEVVTAWMPLPEPYKEGE